MLTMRLMTRAILSHWRLVLLLTLLAGVAATTGDFLRKPSYESEAAILVNVARFNVSSSRADDRQNMAALTAVEAVTSEAEALRSRELVEQLVDQIDPAVLDSPPPRSPALRAIRDAVKSAVGVVMRGLRAVDLMPPENPHYDLIERIESKLDVSTVRQAQVIRVSLRAGSADGARFVLNKLIDLYMQHTAAQRLERTETANLTQEAARLRGQLDQAELELSELRAKYGVSDIAAERTHIADRLNRLSMLVSADASSGAPESVAVADAPGGDAANQGAAPQIAQLHSRLNGLRIDRAGEAAMYSPQDARVHALDEQIALTEALLRKETAALVLTIDRYRARLDELLKVEPRFSRLLRDISILSDSYDIYRKAAGDHQILRQQEAQVEIRVLDPPSMPYQRKGPTRIVIVGAGLGVGFAIGLGLAILLASGAAGLGSSNAYRRAGSSKAGPAGELVTAFDAGGADLSAP